MRTLSIVGFTFNMQSIAMAVGIYTESALSYSRTSTQTKSCVSGNLPDGERMKKDEDEINFEAKAEAETNGSGCTLLILSIIVGAAVGNLAGAPWGWLAFVGAVVVLSLIDWLCSDKSSK